MDSETGRQGPCWREMREVLQSVGRIEWGVGRELGEPLAGTRPLWVSRCQVWRRLGLRQNAV